MKTIYLLVLLATAFLAYSSGHTSGYQARMEWEKRTDNGQHMWKMDDAKPPFVETL